MKKLFIYLILIVIFATPVFGFQNSPNGFRGVAWNDAASKFKNEMTMIEKQGDTTFFVRSNDKMSIGACPIEKIFYKFDSQGFVGVQIQARYEHNYMKLLKACIENWGVPKKGHMYFYKWHDDTAKVDCIYNTNTEKILMLIYSAEG